MNTERSRCRSYSRAVAWCVIALLVSGVLLISVAIGRAQGYRSCARAHLLHVRKLLWEYADEKGAFPQLQSSRGGGTFAFSWRVELLEFLGERDPEVRLRLNLLDGNSSWNSVRNLQVSDALSRSGYGYFHFKFPLTGEVQIYATVCPDSVWSTTQRLNSTNSPPIPGGVLLVAVPKLDHVVFEPFDLTLEDLERLSDEGVTLIALDNSGRVFEWSERDKVTSNESAAEKNGLRSYNNQF